MECPHCNKTLVESNTPIVFNDGLYYQEYFCFSCYTLYDCSSESGDMIEENLNEIGDI